MIRISAVITLLLILLGGFCFHESVKAEKPAHYDDYSEQDDRSRSLYAFRELITAEDLEYHLSILAGDEMMGRGTGQEGIDLAADYIARQLRSFGVTPAGDNGSWFQQFDLTGSVTRSIQYTLSEAGDMGSVIWEAEASRNSPAQLYNVFGGEMSISGDVVFAGLGIQSPADNINHLDGVSVRGKWVMLFGEFHEDAAVSEQIEALMNRRAQQLLFRNGARGILLIEHTNEEEFAEEAARRSILLGKPSSIRLPERGGRGTMALGAKSVSPELAAKMLGLEHTGELAELHRNISVEPELYNPRELGLHLRAEADRREVALPSRNIIAVVEGCDPVLKDEYVVLSAHYDHLGIGQPDESGDMIYNGADDNGSGTVTTLLMAKAVQEARENGYCFDRSVMFLFVTGEEHGLLGSRYYSDNPVVPIEQTVANFNLDMFGRIDHEYENTGKDYIYIIGADIISSGLDRLLHKANERSENLILDMRYNDLDDRNQFYRRSDHWNFGRLGVPFIFFFSGLHDDYHQPSDTVDLIPFDLLEKRARLIYATLVEVANAPERPEVDNQEFIERTR